MNHDLTSGDWESMYLAQCVCTDEWAAKYREEVERKADATLLARCAELEAIAANANKLVTAEREKVARLERALAGEATEEMTIITTAGVMVPLNRYNELVRIKNENKS